MTIENTCDNCECAKEECDCSCENCKCGEE
jgi:hypothetical protein